MVFERIANRLDFIGELNEWMCVAGRLTNIFQVICVHLFCNVTTTTSNLFMFTMLLYIFGVDLLLYTLLIGRKESRSPPKLHHIEIYCCYEFMRETHQCAWWGGLLSYFYNINRFISALILEKDIKCGGCLRL